MNRDILLSLTCVSIAFGGFALIAFMNYQIGAGLFFGVVGFLALEGIKNRR